MKAGEYKPSPEVSEMLSRPVPPGGLEGRVESLELAMRHFGQMYRLQSRTNTISAWAWLILAVSFLLHLILGFLA